MELVKREERVSGVRKKIIEGLAVLVKRGEVLVLLVKRELVSHVNKKMRAG